MSVHDEDKKGVVNVEVVGAFYLWMVSELVDDTEASLPLNRSPSLRTIIQETSRFFNGYLSRRPVYNSTVHCKRESFSEHARWARHGLYKFVAFLVLS